MQQNQSQNSKSKNLENTDSKKKVPHFATRNRLLLNSLIWYNLVPLLLFIGQFFNLGNEVCHIEERGTTSGAVLTNGSVSVI